MKRKQSHTGDVAGLDTHPSSERQTAAHGLDTNVFPSNFSPSLGRVAPGRTAPPRPLSRGAGPDNTVCTFCIQWAVKSKSSHCDYAIQHSASAACLCWRLPRHCLLRIRGSPCNLQEYTVALPGAHADVPGESS